ncbi:MAG TPA: hypothetical protein VEK08_12660 [Planctomycetota bacterium]|nr:hypothetical protein [Planctomycetota bacterium]
MRSLIAIAAIVLVNAAFAAQDTPRGGASGGQAMQSGQSAQQCQQQVAKIQATVNDLNQQLQAARNSTDPQTLRALLNRVETGLDQIGMAASQSGGRMQQQQRSGSGGASGQSGISGQRGSQGAGSSGASSRDAQRGGSNY